MDRIAVIVPTCRVESIKRFIESWHFPKNCELFIIEDYAKPTFPIIDFMAKSTYEVINHRCWQDFEEEFGDDAWIFSKQTAGGCRSYGFWLAYKNKFDYILTLDDDCLPFSDNKYEHEQFIQTHLDMINQSDSYWQWTTKEIKSRGVPYQNLGHRETLINMGFWRRNADLDGISQLIYGARDLEPKILNPVMPGYYYPMCAMNLFFRVKAVPMMYFLLMGSKYNIDRFDDIWCGIVSKKICDHLGYLVRAGKPSLIHERASNVWINIEKEWTGLKMNEDFWKIIDKIDLKEKTIVGCYKEIAEVLKTQISSYYRKLGEAMGIWANLFITA